MVAYKKVEDSRCQTESVSSESASWTTGLAEGRVCQEVADVTLPQWR